MKSGDLRVTVFQDAISQGKGALDTVLKLARGENTDRKVFTTLELVTKDNMDKYLNKN